MTVPLLAHGDFTKLASNYGAYRPGYGPDAIRLITGAMARPIDEVDVADIGAGTGIWTRQIHAAGARAVIAIEPNDEMRKIGWNSSAGLPIRWQVGTAEDTGLLRDSAMLLTMASSFHWADFPLALAEFRRVLSPGGWFVALWNTRNLDESPLLIGIEAELKRLVPELSRISSGNSSFTNGLTSRLMQADGWGEPIYAECFHTEPMSVERYIGVWRSVNDVQVQAGPKRFSAFIHEIRERLSDTEVVKCQYRTRIWMVQKL